MSYGFRLACVSLAAFFLVNFALATVASWLAPAAICIAGRMRARSAARFLLVLRLSPSATGLLAVAALCIPSYLRFEPEETGESVGVTCLIAVILCLAACAASLIRTTRAVVLSRRAMGLKVALAGIIRPRVVVSDEVRRLLSSKELNAALRHERAHAASRDNLKRFLILLAPDTPTWFAGLARLERAWKKFAEWAADDEAAGGDPAQALALASALVRVAGLGSAPNYALLTSLTEDDLVARVDRLLGHPPQEIADRWTPVVCAAGVIALLAVIVQPDALPRVYVLLERFIQ